MSNPPPIFDRLAGLETEYAVRFHADHPGARRPSNLVLFDALVAELRRLMPLAPAIYGKKGFFLATGGAIWYERARQGPTAALVEGSTPECRGPRQLLAAQRAQDELLAAAARDTSKGGAFALCKSDCDAEGHTYGAQENYEVGLPGGWRWSLWRMGLAILVPVTLLTWIVVIGLVFVLAAYYLVAWVLYLPLVAAVRVVRAAVGDRAASTRVPGERRLHATLFGREFYAYLGGDAHVDGMPDWLESILYRALHGVIAPVAVALGVLARGTVFGPVTRGLVPFLVSRVVIAGNGRLARDGRFHLASKAAGVNCVASVNEVFGRRPIVSFGHLLKALLFFSLTPDGRYSSLLSPRQRLQVSVGDSNLCEEAEFLRVGTTMLVLDAMEAGYLQKTPRLRRPVRALRRIAADPTLRATVRLAGGRRVTAIELQRIYLQACQRFVADHPKPPGGALEVCRRWAAVLNDLEREPGRAVGRVDWVTKRELIVSCGHGVGWEEQKKIDLRYHELSAEGYYHRWREAGMGCKVLEEREIERAMRVPPDGSPAVERARYIREFATDPTLRCGWGLVTFGSPPATRWVPLASPPSSPPTSPAPPPSPPPSVQGG